MTGLYILAIIIYIIIALLDMYNSSGFLNAGYSTHDNRDLTTKDVRKALIWPVRFFFIWFPKLLIYLINDIIVIPFLLVGYKYKKSKLYKWIDNFDL